MVASFFLFGLFIYAPAINVAAYAVFAADKRRARLGLRRIPEKDLLGYAMAGGAIGAVLAQQILRHKTRKQPFRSQLMTILAIQVLAAAAILGVRLAHIAIFPVAASSPL